jgi:hypothetical protein
VLKVLGQRIEKDKKRIDEFNIFMYLRAIEIRERTRQLDELMGGSIVNANLIAERFSEEDMNYLVNEQVHIIQGYNHLLEQKKRINDDINEILLYENIIEVLADLVYI